MEQFQKMSSAQLLAWIIEYQLMVFSSEHLFKHSFVYNWHWYIVLVGKEKTLPADNPSPIASSGMSQIMDAMFLLGEPEKMNITLN